MKQILILLILILVTACGTQPLVQPENDSLVEPVELTSISTVEPDISPSSTPTKENNIAVEITPSTIMSKPTVVKESKILENSKFGWMQRAPDSSKLLYTRFSNEFLEVPNGAWEKGEIWLFDLTTQEHKQLISNGQVASWAPDGQNLSVSIINPQTKMYNIVIYDLNTQSTTLVGNALFYYTKWISNDKLVFMSNQTLKTVNLSGQVVRETTLGKRAINTPSRIVNLNSRLITYDNQGNLVKVNILTGQVETIITEAMFDWITMSPSNKNLAYITLSTPPIFGILNLETGDNKSLLQAGDYDFINPRMFNPIWSPDGQFIALTTSKTTGTNVPTDVYLFEINNRQMYEIPLLKNIDYDSLAWSPNGKHLTYSRTSIAEFSATTSVFIAELK